MGNCVNEIIGLNCQLDHEPKVDIFVTIIPAAANTKKAGCLLSASQREKLL